MGTPGSGRYTTYVPVNSNKNNLLRKLFKGSIDIYGSNAQGNNAVAATAAVAKRNEVVNGQGDIDFWGPNGVSLSYGTAPNTTEVEWSKAGDPANPYVPDLSSPGAGKTDGVDKDVDPGLLTTDIKPNFDPNNPSVNTTSPSATSPRLGTTSLGENLQGGKSSVI